MLGDNLREGCLANSDVLQLSVTRGDVLPTLTEHTDVKLVAGDGRTIC